MQRRWNQWTFHHRMWGMKSWEESQISGLGGDATKQDTGRRAGLRAGGSFRVSSTELSGPRMAVWVTPSAKGRVTQRDRARNREQVVMSWQSTTSRRKTNNSLTCGRKVQQGKGWKMPVRWRKQDALRTLVKAMAAKLWERKSDRSRLCGKGEVRGRDVWLRSC